jgi:uncharacterized protein (DUF4213/DUF364 family)
MQACGLSIADLSTRGYYTTVTLSEGSQGVATNFLNVQSPYATPYEQHFYDETLRELAKSDPLLEEMILRMGYMNPLTQSVKAAILNAVSQPLLAADRLASFGLRLSEGALDVASLLLEGDKVTMIDCAGAVCRSVASVGDRLKSVHYCDLSLSSPFRQEVQADFEMTFQRVADARMIDTTAKESACKGASVVVIGAHAICNDTLDETLEWSRGAREVVVVGRSYAMDPAILFQRGATALETSRVCPSVLKDRPRFRQANAIASQSCFETLHVTPI